MTMNDFIRQAAGRQPAEADAGDDAPKLVPRGTAVRKSTSAPTEPRVTARGNAGTGSVYVPEPMSKSEQMNAWIRKAKFYKSIELKEIIE